MCNECCTCFSLCYTYNQVLFNLLFFVMPRVLRALVFLCVVWFVYVCLCTCCGVAFRRGVAPDSTQVLPLKLPQYTPSPPPFLLALTLLLLLLSFDVVVSTDIIATYHHRHRHRHPINMCVCDAFSWH